MRVTLPTSDLFCQTDKPKFEIQKLPVTFTYYDLHISRYSLKIYRNSINFY